MANTKASDESAAAALDGTEIVRIVQSGSSVRTTVQDILDINAFSGAMVKKSADQTTADYTVAAAVAFNTEVYDVGGWHDTVTNNSRFTVPSGVTRIRLHAQALLTSITASMYVIGEFFKNGAAISPREVNANEISAGFNYLIVDSNVLTCVAGDYFEFVLTVETDTSVTVVADATTFSIKKVS